MKKIIYLVFIASLFATSLVVANKSGHRSISYEEINAILSYADKVRSPLVKIVSNVVINEEGLDYSDLRLWLTRGEETIREIVVTADGVVHLPVIDDQVAKDTLLNINQDEGVVSLSVSTAVTTPEKKEVAYRDLFIILEDSNDFIKEMVGAVSWLMPDMDRLEFRFDGSASIEILSERKHFRYVSDEDNTIEIKVKTRLMKENPMVIFSDLPTQLEPRD